MIEAVGAAARAGTRRTDEHDLPPHPLRRGRHPAHPPPGLAVRRQDPLPPPARGRELRLPHPAPPLRQEPLGVGARELLRPHPGRRVARHLRRHRHRPRADRRPVALRHPALQLLRLRRHPRDPTRALRRLLPHRDPRRAGAQRGPVSRRRSPPHPRPPRRGRQAPRAVPVRGGQRHPDVRADRRVRQLRQHGAGAPRPRGLRVVHPRRRLLPQLLRHVEGRRRGERRRPRAAVHHRGLAHHDGRRDQRLQHRREHQPRRQVQRPARLHRGGGAGPAGTVPGPRRVRPGHGHGPRGDARVVRRLPLRQGRAGRPLQHRHGALLPEARRAEPAHAGRG